MNINIYYLSKKIILQLKNTDISYPNAMEIDNLKKKQIQQVFDLFIKSEQNVFVFETKLIEKGLDKLKKTFKLIYAAGGLIEQNNHYLFIYRLKKWDLPKGKLDIGESPEEAAIRECEEECGITKLAITKELDPTYHIYEYKKGFALKKTYWYAMQTKHTGVLIPQLEENIEEVKWFNDNDIEEVVKTNTYPAILDVINHI